MVGNLKTAEDFSQLPGFDFSFKLVGHNLIGRTGPVMGAVWFDPVGHRFKDLDNFPLEEIFSFGQNFNADQFTR